MFGVHEGRERNRPTLQGHEQREIARLAASGLTNKEIGKRRFLSQHTVGTHPYQVLPKLGITSRASLRDALGGLGEETPAAAQSPYDR